MVTPHAVNVTLPTEDLPVRLPARLQEEKYAVVPQKVYVIKPMVPVCVSASIVVSTAMLHLMSLQASVHLAPKLTNMGQTVLASVHVSTAYATLVELEMEVVLVITDGLGLAATSPATVDQLLLAPTMVCVHRSMALAHVKLAMQENHAPSNVPTTCVVVTGSVMTQLQETVNVPATKTTYSPQMDASTIATATGMVFAIQPFNVPATTPILSGPTVRVVSPDITTPRLCVPLPVSMVLLVGTTARVTRVGLVPAATSPAPPMREASVVAQIEEPA
eukprot:TRINITY_DN18256_c0_g1_i1.p2 TRINITY_DN18256_c0_g1~~TRINITY_DN18256_c0_g1_i1.p2  ORF type:complete len:276 (+),score=-4.42 TRINITY_DN18256_c0_g1_i1:21-848(+)